MHSKIHLNHPVTNQNLTLHIIHAQQIMFISDCESIKMPILFGNGQLKFCLLCAYSLQHIPYRGGIFHGAIIFSQIGQK